MSKKALFSESERRLPEKTSVVIARTIRAAILDGRLAPGEPLREVQLAGSLGTSRTPVREALILLESEGLVEGAANRGSTVKRYERAELEELYDIRAALEGHAARAAAARMEDGVVEALEASCDRFRRLRTARQIVVPCLTEENLTFHNIILSVAGSDRLTRMVKEVTALPSIHTAYMAYSDEHRETVEEAHRGITAALAAGDALASAERMQAHVLWAKERALARFSQPDPA
ncbi:MAG: GntR family transcriptional regulator [Candidatus Nanopelagicales bacterium]